MNDIKNYESYNNKMRYSINDKIFFMEYLKNDIKVVVDYGCADGSLINALISNRYYRDLVYIGFDKNDKMIEIAKEKLKEHLNKNVFFFSDFNDVIKLCTLYKGNKLINFSSVVHEMKEFCFPIMDSISLKNIFKYISIRDMYHKNNECYDYISLYNSVRDYTLFENYISNKELSSRNILQFFLKYDYLENWEKEKNEEYFIELDTIEKILYNNYYDCLFKKFYCLNFIKKKVERDFNVDFDFNTHVKAIYVLRSK